MWFFFWIPSKIVHSIEIGVLMPQPQLFYFIEKCHNHNLVVKMSLPFNGYWRDISLMSRDPCFKFLIKARWYTWPRTHLLRANKLPHTNDYPIGTHSFQPPERDISLINNITYTLVQCYNFFSQYLMQQVVINASSYLYGL